LPVGHRRGGGAVQGRCGVWVHAADLLPHQAASQTTDRRLSLHLTQPVRGTSRFLSEVCHGFTHVDVQDIYVISILYADVRKIMTTGKCIFFHVT